MKVTQKGQVTIPKRFRDRLLLKTNSKVVFEEKEDGILIKPAKNTDVETIMAETKLLHYLIFLLEHMLLMQIINCEPEMGTGF
jgi:AbrB family looped-hinge helix DNA binding protein